MSNPGGLFPLNVSVGLLFSFDHETSPESTQTAAVALRHFLRGVDHVGDEAALHALPALLDGDVARPHQGEDVSGQLGEGVLHVDGIAG